MQKAFVTLSLVVSLAAPLSLIPRDSHAQNSKTATGAEAIHAGQGVFAQNCMQCHSVNDGQVMFGPSLFGEMKKPKGKSAAEVRSILKNGKGKMPSFAEKLSPEDENNLLAYLRTI